MTRPLQIDGMYGLGDNIYQRSILRVIQAERPVWLTTPWPQLYYDLPNVHCLRPHTRLRTQEKNSARAWPWANPPAGAERRRWHYVQQEGASIIEALWRNIGRHPLTVDMSGPAPLAPSPVGGKYVVVRPATVRTEWRAQARNPRPEYLAAAARAAQAQGLTVVSVADLDPRHETLDGEAPPADVQYHAGELPIEQLLALVAGASSVIGGVGWLLPAALAYRVPMLLVYGGWGFYNHPGRVLGPFIDHGLITQVLPDAFCMCKDAAHNCNKEIADYDAIISRHRF
jgi:hypothetical protein